MDSSRIDTPRFYMTSAGVSIEVSSSLTATELGLDAMPGLSLSPAEHRLARVAVRWEISERPCMPMGEPTYDPGAPDWKMYRVGQDFVAVISDGEQEGTASAKSVLRANSSWDEATLTGPALSAEGRSQLTVRVAQLLLCSKIVFVEGLVFHASGINDNGRGLVYVGHSGAGKSTQARLWAGIPGAIAINDDCIAVRISGDGRATCDATPWGGPNTRRDHQAPLAAILLPEQAPENEIARLSAADAAPLLLARAFLPYWDKALMQRALANVNSILATVPVYRLRCRPDMEAVSLARSVL